MRQIDHTAGRRGARAFYGRRRGHRLRERQARLLGELLPDMRVPEAAPGSCEPAALFAFAPRAVWLEIGFGSAEHLLWQATRHPDIGFLGAEPYVNGVAKLVAAIADLDPGNIRIHDGDARDLLDWLAPASIARAFILFPDPWPKSRHHKRRVVNDEMLAALARTVIPGGIVRVASDIADYQRWILEHFLRCDAFEWLACRALDWRQRPPDWPPTRYEEKALAAGRRPAYLTFRRL